MSKRITRQTKKLSIEPAENFIAKLPPSLKHRKTVFQPRTSPLDYETLEREKNSMRGFFLLFWDIMFIYVLLTCLLNYRKTGYVIGTKLANVFTKDIISLGISDIVMVLSTFIVVPFQKLVSFNFISPKVATGIQHFWQLHWFTGCMMWALYKNWPWIQTATFVIHSIATLMKQHSYCAYNIELCQKLKYFKKIQNNSNQNTEEISELEKELFKREIQYPYNISFMNYWDFLLIPTFVYELEYPRNPKFRPIYFISKVLATLATFMLLYVTVEHYIHPVINRIPDETFLESLIQVLLPFTICYLLIFFIIFECICNAFAELTLFADRGFYQDWWNSETYDDFARKWNKPVHEFLLRHVYLETIGSLRFSKKNATLATFLLSSLLHELVLVMIGRRIRPYLFLFQMSQIPFIYIGRAIAIRKYPLVGNQIFWFGTIVGPPLINYLYCREYMLEQ